MLGQQLLKELGLKGERRSAACSKQKLLEQESWSTARNSVDVLQKVVEDSDMGKQGQEAMG